MFCICRDRIKQEKSTDRKAGQAVGTGGTERDLIHSIGGKHYAGSTTLHCHTREGLSYPANTYLTTDRFGQESKGKKRLVVANATIPDTSKCISWLYCTQACVMLNWEDIWGLCSFLSFYLHLISPFPTQFKSRHRPYPNIDPSSQCDCSTVMETWMFVISTSQYRVWSTANLHLPQSLKKGIGNMARKQHGKQLNAQGSPGVLDLCPYCSNNRRHFPVSVMWVYSCVTAPWCDHLRRTRPDQTGPDQTSQGLGVSRVSALLSIIFECVLHTARCQTLRWKQHFMNKQYSATLNAQSCHWHTGAVQIKTSRVWCLKQKHIHTQRLELSIFFNSSRSHRAVSIIARFT